MDEVPMTAQGVGSGDPRQSGLTLIEIVIAVGIFTLLVGTVAGVFATFARGQRSGLEQATLLGDAQTFLELLEREVRTGYGNTFSGSGSTFAFKNQEGLPVTYGLDSTGTRIQRNGVAVTSAAFEVRSLDFSVTASGVDPGPPSLLTGQQGRVTVRVHVCPRGITDDRCLITQATLTSRQYAPI